MNSSYGCLEELESDSSLSQGDVIVWERPQDFLSKAAVVVTADCDLAKGKHWGRITVVPLVPAADYMEEIYLPKQLGALEEELDGMFGKFVQEAIGDQGAEPPSQVALESLVSLYGLPAPLDGNPRLVLIHGLLRQVRGLSKSMSAAKALDEALRLRSPGVKALSSSRIGTFLEKPPGDCMILPQMPGLASGLHVAFLRAMREVRDRDIAIKTSDVTPDRAKRVGRLVPVLRYRLTQMLAQVFSDIGLPALYEASVAEERIKFVASITQLQKGQA